MIDDGKCRQLCRQYPNSLEDEERATLKQRKHEYYKKESWRILFDMIPVHKPYMPLVE